MLEIVFWVSLGVVLASLCWSHALFKALAGQYYQTTEHMMTTQRLIHTLEFLDANANPSDGEGLSTAIDAADRQTRRDLQTLRDSSICYPILEWYRKRYHGAYTLERTPPGRSEFEE